MTATGHVLPHDSAYLSVAKDGDVMIVTDMIGLSPGTEILLALADGRMTLAQGGKVYLDVPVDEERAKDVEAAGSVTVTESGEGTDPSKDEFVVHSMVRKEA